MQPLAARLHNSTILRWVALGEAAKKGGVQGMKSQSSGGFRHSNQGEWALESLLLRRLHGEAIPRGRHWCKCIHIYDTDAGNLDVHQK